MNLYVSDPHITFCLLFQVHNTCCFLPPPPPPPSSSLSKNSIHKHFSLSTDVLQENTSQAEMLSGDLSESYPAHLNRLNNSWRCPYHHNQHQHLHGNSSAHRQKSHCWQNHCCVMSTHLQQQHCSAGEEPQPGGYSYPPRCQFYKLFFVLRPTIRLLCSLFEVRHVMSALIMT